MKFPKQELDIDVYLQKIKELLNDNSCHIFIDTNIISQLYRLNELARDDFYKWVDSCSDRFHIPNWSVHEYSKRVTTQNTKDYLSELTKAKTYSKELANISLFIKGYVGDSLLIGSSYAGRKEELFQDIDSVVSKFEIIANAINKNLIEHQQNVHKEVLDKLNEYTINSDIYTIIGNLCFEHDLRFESKVPPGFKDSDKVTNRIGDLIIWKEIIDFCKKRGLKNEKAKVIFVSRDLKPDMVYHPVKQTRGGNPIKKEEDKIKIAQESLVYEFKTITESEDFYLISFYTLVQVLASDYRELAISFQIATEQENTQATSEKLSSISDIAAIEETNESDKPKEGEIEFSQDNKTVETNTPESAAYSLSALADSEYDITEGLASINECIENLKTYNWYKQNPAINKLSTLSFHKAENTQQNRDSFFVLGRNVLQSADGTAGSAMHFLDNLHYSISDWPKPFQQAFIDGCLYEVFLIL
jgi:predicted nucleic acid-binding protein